MKSQFDIELEQESSKYKLIIPSNVESIIRYFLNRFYNTEWSGILFYNYTGSFETKDFVATCKDIMLMDVGSTAFTSFDYSPEVASYIAQHPELINCKLALIHSHHQMSTNFSGTDIETLRKEGADRVHFLSLIVNNEGTYSAKITKKVKTTSKCIDTYTTFNNVVTSKEYEKTIETVVWDDLDIEVETSELNEYKEWADIIYNKVKSKSLFKDSIDIFNKSTNSVNLSLFNDDYTSKNQEIPAKNTEGISKFDKYNINTYKDIDMDESLIMQLSEDPEFTKTVDAIYAKILTGCILTNSFKDNSWLNNMEKFYDIEFPPTSDGEISENFDSWMNVYIPFIVDYHTDLYLMKSGNNQFTSYDLFPIIGELLVTKLDNIDKKDKNKYIEYLIQNVEEIISIYC